MENCTHSINKESKGYKKISLNGVIHTCRGKKAVIYDSKVFECFGMISFINKGYCSVEIFKNNMNEPVAVVKPGDSFTLTSNPFCRIEIKCKNKCNCNNCKSYKKCETHETCRCKTIYEHKKDYKYPNSDGCIPSKKNMCCKKSRLCYEGFVYVIFDCDANCIHEW